MATRERIYDNHRDGSPALYTERREDGLYLCDASSCVNVADEEEADVLALQILAIWQREGEDGEELHIAIATA